jgi:hypothetical protein
MWVTIYYSTQSNILEDLNVQKHRCDLKSCHYPYVHPALCSYETSSSLTEKHRVN